MTRINSGTPNYAGVKVKPTAEITVNQPIDKIETDPVQQKNSSQRTSEDLTPSGTIVYVRPEPITIKTHKTSNIGNNVNSSSSSFASVKQTEKCSWSSKGQILIKLPKIFEQNGPICKPMALANLDYFYATEYKIPNIPLYVNHRNIYQQQRNYNQTTNPILSIRKLAKQTNSKQGEVLQYQDLEQIAQKMGYNTQNEQPQSIEAFRALVVYNLEKNNPILTCFAVNIKTGLPSTMTDEDEEHACLIIGYDFDEDTISIAQWGRTYINIPLSELYKSMCSLPVTRQIEKYGTVVGFGVNNSRSKYHLVKEEHNSKFISIQPRDGSGFRNRCFMITPNIDDPRWQEQPHELNMIEYEVAMKNKLILTKANPPYFEEWQASHDYLLAFLLWMYSNDNGSTLNQMFEVNNDASISVTFRRIKSATAITMINAHKNWMIDGKPLTIDIDSQTNSVTFNLSKAQTEYIEHHEKNAQNCSHLSIHIFEHLIPFFFGTQTEINRLFKTLHDKSIADTNDLNIQGLWQSLTQEDEPINLHSNDNHGFGTAELCAVFNIHAYYAELLTLKGKIMRVWLT